MAQCTAGLSVHLQLCPVLITAAPGSLLPTTLHHMIKTGESGQMWGKRSSVLTSPFKLECSLLLLLPPAFLFLLKQKGEAMTKEKWWPGDQFYAVGRLPLYPNLFFGRVDLHCISRWELSILQHLMGKLEYRNWEMKAFLLSRQQWQQYFVISFPLLPSKQRRWLKEIHVCNRL